MAHSTLGPSQASRWIGCPGSVALCAKAPKQKTSFAAAEGTVAHTLAEAYVTGMKTFEELEAMVGTIVKQEGHDIEIIEEMVTGAAEYRDTILEDRAMIEASKGDNINAAYWYAEQEVHAKSVDERAWGRLDYTTYRKGDVLIVDDYKFGKGLVVDPEENAQLALYAIGVMDMPAVGWDFKRVILKVIQPRGSHIDGTVREWVTTVEWLREFRDKAKAAAAETLRPDARVVPGDHCRWCSAKPFCPAIHAGIQAQAQVDFDIVPRDEGRSVLPDVRLLTIEKISAAAHWEKAVVAWFAAIKDVIQEKLSAGEEVVGWKLVDGRAHRQWIDEDAVVAEFGSVLGEEKMFEPRKLLSPAKLEKIIGKKRDISHLVEKPEGKKSIAPDTDPRPKARTSAQDDFSVTESIINCMECDIMGTCGRHMPLSAAAPEALSQGVVALAKNKLMLPAAVKGNDGDLMDELTGAAAPKRLWPI